jgi:hypothetical protein
MLCRLQGLSDADIKQLQAVLDEQVEANLGMAMVYTLIGVAQEWLNEKVQSRDVPCCSRFAACSPKVSACFCSFARMCINCVCSPHAGCGS